MYSEMDIIKLNQQLDTDDKEISKIIKLLSSK